MNKEKLIHYCQKLHIDTIGIAPWPLPLIEAKKVLFEQDPCPFTAGQLEDRLQGNTKLENPQSAIVCLFPYYINHHGSSNLARYTWAQDYHLVIPSYLEKIIAFLKEDYPQAEFEIHCDTSPLADRYVAYLAGLGFYGKNHCFINPHWGSYVVIGTIITSISFEADSPLKETCLNCSACIQSCPGQALSKNGFNYHTCKSYLSQVKGELSSEEAGIISKTPLVFGCDICQEVCPHNQGIPETPIPEFQNIEPLLSIDSLENLTNRQFKEAYGHRAFSWRGKKILQRNHQYICNKNKKE